MYTYLNTPVYFTCINSCMDPRITDLGRPLGKKTRLVYCYSVEAIKRKKKEKKKGVQVNIPNVIFFFFHLNITIILVMSLKNLFRRSPLKLIFLFSQYIF